MEALQWSLPVIASFVLASTTLFVCIGVRHLRTDGHVDADGPGDGVMGDSPRPYLMCLALGGDVGLTVARLLPQADMAGYVPWLVVESLAVTVFACLVGSMRVRAALSRLARCSREAGFHPVVVAALPLLAATNLAGAWLDLDDAATHGVTAALFGVLAIVALVAFAVALYGTTRAILAHDQSARARLSWASGPVLAIGSRCPSTPERTCLCPKRHRPRRSP